MRISAVVAAILMSATMSGAQISAGSCGNFTSGPENRCVEQQVEGLRRETLFKTLKRFYADTFNGRSACTVVEAGVITCPNVPADDVDCSLADAFGFCVVELRVR